MLLARVIKKELGFTEPTIMIGEDIVYEEGEDIDPSEFAVNLSKSLVNLPAGGMGHGSIIRVEDFTQNLEVEVSVSHKDHWVIVDKEKKGETQPDNREEIEKFEIGGKMPVATTDTTAAAADSSSAKDEEKQPDDDSDDDIELVEMDDQPKEDSGASVKESNGSSSKKRSLEEDEPSSNGVKKAKVVADNDEVIEIE